jgi:hypothetical protein
VVGQSLILKGTGRADDLEPKSLHALCEKGVSTAKVNTVSKLIRIAVLPALALVLCGWDSADLGAYSGEPVAVARAKFGPPIGTAFIQGEKIYFWRVRLSGGDVCKVWGAARHRVILFWGYQTCVGHI